MTYKTKVIVASVVCSLTMTALGAASEYFWQNHFITVMCGVAAGVWMAIGLVEWIGI